tara:strand:- start:385 stop:708 length:324 start_codon:yes stop_codon:yes gene_type:complete
MSTKIRNLFNDSENGEVVFTDIINKFVESSDALQELEFKNNKHTYSRAIKDVIQVQNLIKEFKRRLQKEVLPEIAKEVEGREKKYQKNHNKIIEANNKRHGRDDKLI